MKNLLLILFCCLGVMSLAQAQNNPGFSYQAVARDANGMTMANQKLELRLAIIQDNTGAGNGAILYRETHQPTTNEYGLFTLTVGKGTVAFGDFQQLDWAKMNLFLQVDIDLNSNQTYTFMGKTRILPVPVALHAMSADNVDDADADPTNELQFLQYDSLTNTLQLTGANSIQLPLNGNGVDADADPQNEIQVLSQTGINVTLSEGGGTISVADNDNNPNNELQSLSRVGNQIALSNGGGSFVDETQDADADPTNEIQVVGFDPSTSVLRLSNGGGQVDLSVLKNTGTGGTGTDDQQLTLNGTILSIEDGNSIDLASLPKNDADADAQNELQQITFDTTSYILRLSDGGQVDLSSLKSFGTGGTTQNLSLNGTSLAITGGNTVDLSNLPDQVNDADADPQNEIQAISFDTTTNILTLSNGGTVDLTSLKASSGSAVLQNLALNGTSLSISGGNQIDLSNLPDQVNDADADPQNEIQAISFDASSKVLTLSNGGTVDLSGLSDGVNDADADPQNEIQAISFDTTTNILTLSNGGTVDLTSLKASSGSAVLQNLTLNGTSLSISGGNQIDLSNLPDQVNDADADPQNEIQAISFDASSKVLTLSNGGTVDLSGLSDGVNDADADPQNEIQAISFDASSKVLTLSNGGTVDLSGLSDGVNDADADPQNEIQQLTLDTSTNMIQLSQNGGLLDLSYLANTGNNNNQTLQLNGKDLSISDGNTISLDSLGSPWEIKNGFIEYTKGKTKVEELYAQKGDTTISINYQGLLLDEDPFIVGDETILDNQGFRIFENASEYTRLDADSLYFTYNPKYFTSNRDVRSSTFTSERLSIEDTLEVAQLSSSGLQFDFSENKGDYAYYGHDSLSFAYNYNVLLPFFSNMDATKLEFWSVGGETKHHAAYSEYFIGKDTLTIDAYGLVNKGSTANTAYEKFRLEANDFTMRNDARWKTFDFTTPSDANAATFNMYPGTGLSEYFTLGPSPFDPLSAQLTMQTDSMRSVCLAGHNGVGELCLYNHGLTAFQMTAEGIFGGAEFNMFNNAEIPVLSMLVNGNDRPEFSMRGGAFNITNSLFAKALELGVVNDAGNFILYGANGNANVALGGFLDGNGPNPNIGGVSVFDTLGNGSAFLHAGAEGGELRLVQNTVLTKVRSFIENSVGKQYFYGANNQVNVQIGSFGNNDRGIVAVNDENGAGLATLSVNDQGGAGVFSRSNGNPGITNFIDAQDHAEVSVYNGRLSIFNNSDVRVVDASSTGGSGALYTFGENGESNVSIGSIFDQNRGTMTLNDETGKLNLLLSQDDEGGKWNIFDKVNDGGVAAYVENSVGKMDFTGQNGSLNVQISNGFTSTDHGLLNIYDEEELAQVSLASTANGGAIRMSRLNGNFAVDAYVDASNNARLDVFDGILGVRTQNNFPAVEAKSTSGFGELTLYGADNFPYLSIGAFGTNNTNGQLLLNNSSGNTAIGLSSNDNGGVFFVSNTNSFATISAGTDASDANRVSLDVQDGNIEVTNGEMSIKSDNTTKIGRMYPSLNAGQLELLGTNGELNVSMGTVPFLLGDLNRGIMGVHGINGTYRVYASSNVNGGLIEVNNEAGTRKAGIEIDLFGNGIVWGDVKNFRMDHPKDSRKEIVYASLEGPEAAAYERGTAQLENGEAFIPFSEHYHLVANAETMTVLVTPLSAESTGLAVVEKTDKGFYVKELFKGKGTYQFDWEVKSVRKGYEDFKVIRDKK